jgi:cell division protein FtsL
MTKFVVLVWLVAIAAAAAGLFHVKYQVQNLEEELNLEHRSILHRQEAIHILKAEWSYLNQPARLSDLAKRHLGLAPLDSNRLVRLDDLPRRAERRAEPASADLDAILARARSAR